MSNKKFKSCLLIVNRNCNLNCECCSSIKNTKNASFDDMKEAVKIINKLTNFTVIMGGEPLLYDYIYDLIEYMSSLNMDFTIVTNGTLLSNKTIKKLVDSGLKNITVSFNKFNNDSNMWFDYVPIFNLKKYFDDVSVNILYDSTLVGNLYNIIRFLSENDIWSIVALYNFSDNYREHYLIGDKIDSSYIRNDQVADMMREIRKIVSNYGNLLIHNTKQYIYNILFHYDKQIWHCNYPYRLVVNNDLSIMPCEDMKPMKYYDIFCLESDIMINEFNNIFINHWKDVTSKCVGCYLPCYYDIEILTPLEIAHRGGKNVNYNKTGLKLCVRSKNREIDEMEEHICWFCGSNIRINSSYKTFCKKCGLMKCTSCGKCFCDGTELEKRFLIWINENYCCNYDNLLDFNKLCNFWNLPKKFRKIDYKMVTNAIRCLAKCSIYLNENKK